MSIDHFAEAEQILKKLPDPMSTYEALQTAQVHATLATVQRDVYQVAAERINQPEVTVPARDVLKDAPETDTKGTPVKEPDTLVIPWPPSEELVEKCGWAIAELNDSGDPSIWADDVRAVLDAIHKQVMGDD